MPDHHMRGPLLDGAPAAGVCDVWRTLCHKGCTNKLAMCYWLTVAALILNRSIPRY